MKCGRDDSRFSVSDALSEYERLEDFGVAMRDMKISSDVLPTDHGVQQGDVLRGKPIRLSNTRATHPRYSSLIMLVFKCKNYDHFTQNIK